MHKSVLERGFEAQAKILAEFGYTGIAPEFVARAHADWKVGKQSADVATMFCEQAFKDYPGIFGFPDEGASL